LRGVSICGQTVSFPLFHFREVLMATPKSYRPSVLELEDRSSPSGASGLDWSPDNPFDAPPERAHPVSLVSSDPLSKKPESIDSSTSSAPTLARNPVATFMPVPAGPANPLLRSNARDQAPPVIHETVKASGPAIGNWTVNKKHSETTNTPWGWFTIIHAHAENNQDKPAREEKTLLGSPTALTYLKNGAMQSYRTKLMMRPGAKYTPSARAVGTVTAVTPGSYTWTGAGSSWGVVVNGPTGVVPGEQAEAGIRIQDPVTFPDLQASDRSFTVQFDPAGSWSIDFPPQNRADGIVYQASVTITGAAGSTVPGYDAIFSYSIALTPGHVQVGVTSNPSLKWDDAYVAQTIANAYTWDGDFMTYNGGPLTATIPVFGFGRGLSSASFDLSQDETADVTVPILR
jgi:hypothetical protein